MLHIRYTVFRMGLARWLYLLLPAAGCISNHADQAKSQSTFPTLPPTYIELTERQVTAVVEPFAFDSSDSYEPRTSDEYSRLKLINEIDCTMQPGRGVSADLATLSVPFKNSAQILVVGEDGVVFESDLPFVPDYSRIGHHKDGSVLVGFGDMKMNYTDTNPREFDESVRIYLNGRVVYEGTRTWDFDITDDGSSFAVHEAISEVTSRLLIADLDQRKITYYHLGVDATPSDGYEPGCWMSFTREQTELQVWCFESDPGGGGTYHLYPLQGDTMRKVIVNSRRGTLLTSSGTGYFVDLPDTDKAKEFGDVWKISRRKLNFETENVEDVWSRHYSFDSFHGTMAISENRSWLLLDGWRVHVLDTDTGDLKFKFPSTRDKESQLARLANVLPANATTSDLGRLGGVGFQGNLLSFYRSYGSIGSCSRVIRKHKDRLESLECKRQLRMKGRYRTVYDIYKMEDIEIDSLPNYRTEVYRDTSCNEATSTYRGLLNDDGRLVFRQSDSREN